MKFSRLADAHERLRLNTDSRSHILKMADSEEALMFYEFFFPQKSRLTRSTAIGKVANELEMYFDVAENFMDSKDIWYNLASESSNSASRDYSVDDVLNMPYEDMSFTDIAYRFNEKEARLLWRYLLACKPVISKRSFFGFLARQQGIPAGIVRRTMNRDTIVKLFDDPKSIATLEDWWQHDSFPAPARWRSWLKLTPPHGEWLAVVVPEGKSFFTWAGTARLRNGTNIASAYMNERSGQLIEWSGDTIVDAVPKDEPYIRWDMRDISAKTLDLNVHGNWDLMIEELNKDTTKCVRIIKKDAVYIPDEVQGYTMYPHRSRVFLRVHDIDDSRWTIAALDGLDDFVPVGNVQVPTDLPQRLIPEIDDEDVTVVEVAVLDVDSEGNINNCIYISTRFDMGIGDITQLTELIERGYNV